MEVLSKNYLISTKLKPTRLNSEGKQVSSLSFKAGKINIEQELSKSVIENIKFNNSQLKTIINNPEQKQTFFATLGSIIVSSAMAITQLIYNSDSEEKAPSKIEPPKEQSVIKFSTTRGKIPKIEKDIISFSEQYDENDSITLDKIKLLFNKYCGKNRNGKHNFEGEFIENRVLIQKIFEELKSASENKKQLHEIVSKYLALDSMTNYSSISVNPMSIIAKDTLESNPDTKTEDSSKTKDFNEQLSQIRTILNEYIVEFKLPNEVLKKALQNIKKNFTEDLSQLLFIIETLNDDIEKKNFVIALANKIILSESVKTYDSNLRNTGLTFLQYNAFKNLGINDIAIKELTSLINLRRIKDIEMVEDSPVDTFKIKIPGNFSLNNKFQTIRKTFELITSKVVALNAHEDSKMDKESLLNELKADFKRNQNQTTYKNIVSYLYGNKHEVNTLKDFDKNQYEQNFQYLISILNNDKVFNNNLFSNHSKLRFIERYVLNKNTNPKYLNLKTSTQKKVRLFIESLIKELGKGVNISAYCAADNNEKIGVQIRYDAPELGTIKITLNNDEKMHTII